jgi:hypothetical protein
MGKIFEKGNNSIFLDVPAAIYELRRIAALTWNEIGDIFGVSRRSVHHWVNGKNVSHDNWQNIFSILKAMREFSAGNDAQFTRALLFANVGNGVCGFDLLKKKKITALKSHFAKVMEAREVLCLSGNDSKKEFFSDPVLLLGSNYERPDIESKPKVLKVLKRKG